MLLVVIAALLSHIVTGWWREAREARRLAMERALAIAERDRAIAPQSQAQAIAAQARASARPPAPAGPTE